MKDLCVVEKHLLNHWKFELLQLEPSCHVTILTLPNSDLRLICSRRERGVSTTKFRVYLKTFHIKF